MFGRMNVTVLVNFIVNHWLLCGLTLIVTVLLIFEELNGQGNDRGLSCEQLVALMNHKKVKLFDLRAPKIFKSGHIRGSINIVKDDLASDPEVEAIILLSENGKVPFALLNKVGKNSYFLVGGINAWQQAKLPLEK